MKRIQQCHTRKCTNENIYENVSQTESITLQYLLNVFEERNPRRICSPDKIMPEKRSGMEQKCSKRGAAAAVYASGSRTDRADGRCSQSLSKPRSRKRFAYAWMNCFKKRCTTTSGTFLKSWWSWDVENSSKNISSMFVHTYLKICHT